MGVDRAVNISELLKGQQLPQSLTQLVENGFRPHPGSGSFTFTQEDFLNNVIDLFNSPGNIRQEFYKLDGCLNTYIDRVITLTKAYHELDSQEKVKQFILDELVENKDIYDLIDYKMGMAGDAFGELYKSLVEAVRLRPDSQEAKTLVDRLGLWENAALDIVLDKEAYFTKTKSGNEGTISEFVGMMVLSRMPSKKSPVAQEAKYFDRVKVAIKYDDIVAGRINKRDHFEFEHQKDLLWLLHGIQTKVNRMPESYWSGILKNPDFIAISYEVAKADKSPLADDLLVNLLKQCVKDGEREIWVRLTLWDHFEDETPYRKFLHDPQNEYETTLKGNLSATPVEAPKMFVHLQDHTFLVLTDYKREGDNVQVGYVEIKDAFNRKTASIDMVHGIVAGVQPQVSDSLLNLVNGFEKFKNDYHAHLAKVKSPSNK